MRYVRVTPRPVPTTEREARGHEGVEMGEGAIYLQTNDAEKNEVVAFRRGPGGELEKLGTYETGGRGSGKPHLPSQSSIVVSGDGRSVLVANAGSGDVSLFAVEADGLRLADRGS